MKKYTIKPIYYAEFTLKYDIFHIITKGKHLVMPLGNYYDVVIMLVYN